MDQAQLDQQASQSSTISPRWAHWPITILLVSIPLISIGDGWCGQLWKCLGHRLLVNCNSTTLNHVYLFNYLILVFISYLFIAFNYLDGKK